MLDRYIAKQIIFAQLASDGGKKDKEVLNRISSFVPLSEVHYKKGYHAKDHCIINAIRAIQRNPQSGFRYHVKADRTLYSGAHVFIVYFNFKIGGGGGAIRSAFIRLTICGDLSTSNVSRAGKKSIAAKRQ